MHPNHFHHIHETVGGTETSKLRPGKINTSATQLGPESQCSGRRQSIQGRAMRRDAVIGQSCDALPRSSFAEDYTRSSTRTAVWNELSNPPPGVAPSLAQDRPGTRLCSSLSASPLGSILGQAEKAEEPAGYQIEGAMVSRQQLEEIREPCQSGATLRKSPCTGSPTSGSIASVVEGDGHKIFYPVTSNGKRPSWSSLLAALPYPRACVDAVSQCMLTILHGGLGATFWTKTFQKLSSAIRSGYFSFVHFGMPCESWSRARKWDGGPHQPLRDDHDFLYGFSALSVFDERKVLRGNALLRATFRLAKECMAVSVPWTIENPATSRAWLTKEMKMLKQLGASPQETHYCQYGKSWRKATIFLSWNLPRFNLKCCSGSHGKCSATGERHFVLQGRNSEGAFYTLIAQPHPAGLCKHIATVLSQCL